MTQTETASKCMGCHNSLECDLTRTVRELCGGPYRKKFNISSLWNTYMQGERHMIISASKPGAVDKSSAEIL